VNALEGDIKVSPGDGTHYELLPRHGLRDVSGSGTLSRYMRILSLHSVSAGMLVLSQLIAHQHLL
jgi:hypothetical protein